MLPKSPDPERRGLLLMLLSLVFFAANVLILRGVSLHTPVADGPMATAFRGLVGLVIVGVGYRGRGLNGRSLIREPLVLARGAVGATSILLFYLTISQLGAGRAVILNLTFPLFGAVMAAAWLQEPLRKRQLAWMCVALAGLGVFFSRTAFQGTFSRYEVYGVLGAFIAGVAVVLIRLLRHREHPATVFGSQCLWSLGVALPFCVQNLAQLPGSAVAGLCLAAICVAVAQLALTYAFGTLSVARGSAIQMLLPLLTALGGWLLYGERLTRTELAGGALTLVATWLAVRPPPRPAQAPA
jgi:S-adenosylmethionine uptake transporter